MNGTGTERLSQEDKRNQAPVNSILEEVEFVAQGVLKSIQATAGTTTCKGVQIARLAEWAKQKGYWVEDVKGLGDYADRGSENEVYLSSNNNIVYKLNIFRYSDNNLNP